MPIKLPKGLQRRKQSGNLDDEVASQQSSFRVIQRPDSQGNIFNGGARRVTGTRPDGLGKGSTEPQDGDITPPGVIEYNRASGGTTNSPLNAPYDSGASSSRLSESSTNPSSIDASSDRNVHYPGQTPISDVPPIPPHSDKPRTLRSAGRTFSAGIKNKKSATREDVELSPIQVSRGNEKPLPPISVRDRSVTESTASTATPPRLDQGLNLDNSLDSFGNMFENMRFSRDMSGALSRAVQEELPSSPPSVEQHVEPLRPNKLKTFGEQLVSSPYSYNSRDGLMGSPSPPATITTRRMQPHYEAESSSSAVRIPESQGTAPGSPRQPRSPEVQRAMPPTSPVLDSNLIANAELAARYEETKPQPVKVPSTNKVMTPAQFERYKQQQEEDRRRGLKTNDDDSEDSIDYDDDEDEVDLARQAAEKKRQQEAKLAVYRQQMKRMTGVPSVSNSRPASSMDLSTPRAGDFGFVDPANRLSHMTLDSKSSLGGKGKSGDEEEDDDIPLGILAAHGFPNKYQPPTRLTSSPSNSNLRAPAAPASVAGDRRESLPVFARKLPQDPYLGASLVNPSHRESFAMHANHSAPSLVATPAASSANPYPVHPSGLVGVIAGEERARALRRGSPNAQGTYDMPGLVPPAMAQPGAVPGMLTPGDHAQIQLTQQMQHFMQVQMQMMQQMMHMNQGQHMQQPGFLMSGPAMPGQGMPGQGMPGQAPLTRSQTMMPSGIPNQRTMSMLNPPSMGGWTNTVPVLPQITIGNNAYAPSLAPSERSNIGLASRYRPVSTVQEPERPSSQRASTFTASTSRPWSQIENYPRPPLPSSATTSAKAIPRKAIMKRDEDDDDAGWAEMKAKKDQKSRTRQNRKDTNALRELYNETMG